MRRGRDIQREGKTGGTKRETRRERKLRGRERDRERNAGGRVKKSGKRERER